MKYETTITPSVLNNQKLNHSDLAKNHSRNGILRAALVSMKHGVDGQRMFSNFVTAMVLAIIGLFQAQASASTNDIRYTITPLPVPMGLSGISPSSINNSNVVACIGGDSLNRQSYFLIQGTNIVSQLQLNPLPGYSDAQSWSENGEGKVVGRSSPGAQATEWSEGQTIALGFLPQGGWSIATDVNKKGQIVGFSDYWRNQDSRSYSACLWENGQIRRIGSEDCSLAYAINEKGRIAGVAWLDPNSTAHAAIWENGGNAIFLTTTTYYSVALGLNELGQVIGYFYVDLYGSIGHGFLWDDQNGLMDLGALGGWSVPSGINNLSEVVGRVWDASNRMRAFLWKDGVMRDLNDLIPPDSGWELQSAAANNDAGFIVGTGTFHGAPAAFLLSPSQGLKIRVDANRDGEINFDDDTDKTTAEKPFHFWLNDDRDVYDTSQKEEDDVPVNGKPDYQHNQIACRRDLEDFTRVHIQAPKNFDPTDATQEIKLQFVDVTEGASGVNLWRAVKPGLEYLTETATADQQLRYVSPVIVDQSAEKAIPLDLFANADKKAAILFEGRMAGKGSLVVRLYKGGQKIGEDKVYLDLKPMNQMYDHWTVGDTVDPRLKAYQIPTTATQIGACSSTPEQNAYILFVHGWRMQSWERRAFAETSYKRLWHQGYKGGFGLYSWPTEWNPGTVWSNVRDSQNYDNSERKAWHSAPGLRGVLAQLSTQYRVNVFAHSMGNIVVGEALRLETRSATPRTLVDTYVATQAASVAHAYDATAPTIFHGGTTPNVYAFFPPTRSPYFMGIDSAASTIVNYHNRRDYALTARLTWEFNQRMKPDWPYSYRHVPGFRTKQFVCDPWNPFNFRALYLPGDCYEIFAYCAEARSRALGAQPDVGGSIKQQLNLNGGLFGYTADSRDHSAEFRSDIMRRAPYWLQLLETFRLAQ